MAFLVLVAAICAIILWGGSPVATKIAVNEISPMVVTIGRTLVGGLAALPFLILLRIPLPVTAEQRVLLAVSGFCGFIAFPLLFTIGVQQTSANHSSMILASLPVFTGAIAMLWDRHRPALLWCVGCVIALIGEFVLMSDKAPGGAGVATLQGDLIVLTSNIFASLGYVSGARLQQSGYPALGTTFWGVALFSILFLPLVPFFYSGIEFQSISTGAWMGVIYLGIAVTVVGYILWYWALGKGGIAKVGLLQFFQPVTGIIFAWILLGEHVTTNFLVASGIIFMGVWLAIRK